jgi:hypothetical protein
MDDMPILTRRRIEAEFARGIYDEMKAELGEEAARRILTNAVVKLAKSSAAGFAAARRTGYRLFGFYAVPNGFFMKGGPPSTDLKYIIGSVWGILNPGPAALTVTIDDKEDYLRSVMMYVLDGGVLRFNNIAPQSAYYKEAGGMQETRTLKRIDASARAMVAAFPDLVTLNLTKKSGMPEVRLRDSRPDAERHFGPDALKSYKMPAL